MTPAIALGTFAEVLAEAATLLGGGRAAAREAREILSAILDVPRFRAASNPREPLSAETRIAVLRAAESRREGAPLQYATGKAAFRHLTLDVDRRVLIPRPETELLVDLVLERHKTNGGTVADIGTGSGAIAIALATEGCFTRVIATDISAGALVLAEKNAEKYSAHARSRIEFRTGSLLEPIMGETLDALVSNPPYIAEAEMADLPDEVRNWEPRGALCGGPDGLEPTREIAAGAADVLEPRGLLALEIDTRRAEASADILRHDSRYTAVEVVLDLTGRQRFILARRR